MPRKSPIQSATLYKVGTKKRGIDKNIWIVNTNKNNIKRWVLFKKSQTINYKPNTELNTKINIKQKTEKKVKKTELEKLLESNNDIHNGKIGKLIKIGKFNVKSKVVVGDIYYEITNLIKGTYYAYWSRHNLIIVHESVKNLGKIDLEWQKTSISVGVDSGTFGFYDLNTVEHIKKMLGGKRIMKNELPMNKFIMKESYIVEPNMIEDVESDDKKFMKEKYGVRGSTHGGDGYFYMYKPKNIESDKNLSKKIAALVGYSYIYKNYRKK